MSIRRIMGFPTGAARWLDSRMVDRASWVWEFLISGKHDIVTLDGVPEGFSGSVFSLSWFSALLGSRLLVCPLDRPCSARLGKKERNIPPMADGCGAPSARKLRKFLPPTKWEKRHKSRHTDLARSGRQAGVDKALSTDFSLFAFVGAWLWLGLGWAWLGLGWVDHSYPSSSYCK